MSFGAWNVRNLCRSGSLTAVGRELARYRLDLVGLQEVRWDKEGTVSAGVCNFSPEKKMYIIDWEKVFFLGTPQNVIIS
jgi:hypothetical protein